MIKKLFVVLVCCIMLTSCNVKSIKSDVYYEIFVASFNDSNNDGVGDLNGVTAKLDYLSGLGVGGIWLMPINPSETYHKYDVDNYYEIDTLYGNIEDFKNLISKAKSKNIDVIIDLVLNHTSDTHPWFIEAKNAFLNGECESNPKCKFYNFSNEKKSGYASIKDGYYYEARFWDGMPDLNLDNLTVREEIKKIVEYWLDLGVKGFRLDAVLYYYSNNVEKNNEFVSWLNKIIKDKKEDSFVVGEVYSSEGVIKSHYDSGIDSLFDFTASGNDGLIVKSINNKNGRDLAKRMVDNYNAFNKPSIFLSNHDQGRSAGYLNSLEKQKLASSIYILSSGIPFIYYGEEIGLKGSGKDENKRLAMLWGEGNDTKNPLNSDYKSQIDTSVKIQMSDKNSLLNHYKKIIKFRNTYVNNFSEVNFIDIDSRVFSIKYDDVIVLINLSDEVIVVENSYKILDKLYKSRIENNKLVIDKYDVVILESKG